MGTLCVSLEQSTLIVCLVVQVIFQVIKQASKRKLSFNPKPRGSSVGGNTTGELGRALMHIALVGYVAGA